MFKEGEGEEEEGRTVWRRTILGWQMEKEKKKEKKNEGRRWSTGRDLSSTWIFGPPQLCQHIEIESLRLELL